MLVIRCNDLSALFGQLRQQQPALLGRVGDSNDRFAAAGVHDLGDLVANQLGLKCHRQAAQNDRG
jgi:hypothetical protein